MLEKIVNNKISILSSVILVGFLGLIRTYEDVLFYDPFLEYFKSEYQNFPIPPTNNIKLFLSLFFRFFLNSILSIAIIYVLFKDTDAIKFASFLYIVFFIILSGTLFFIISSDGEINKMSLFYVRRFLIQPIFLILFLPAFYYQKQKLE
jgi:exosortase F-associated protein